MSRKCLLREDVPPAKVYERTKAPDLTVVNNAQYFPSLFLVKHFGLDLCHTDAGNF